MCERGILSKRLPLTLTITLRQRTCASLRTRNVSMPAPMHRLDRGTTKAFAPGIGAGLESLAARTVGREASALGAARGAIRVATAATARGRLTAKIAQRGRRFAEDMDR